MRVNAFLQTVKRWASAAWRWIRTMLRNLRGRCSHLRSGLVDESSIVLVEEKGKVNLADVKRVCLFAHDDPDGVVDEYVFHYVEELSKAGLGIIFVSSAPKLSGQSVDRLMPCCAWLVHQKRAGAGFGAWKCASRFAGPLESYEEVVLASDTVYGPFVPLSGVFAKMGSVNAALWGITDSWQNRYHVESHFMVLRKDFLASAAFKTFWESIRFVLDREFIRNRYETGLTQAAIRAGFTVAALCPYDKALEAGREKLETRYTELASGPRTATRLPEMRYWKGVLRRSLGGEPLEPSVFLWDVLIEGLGSPFLRCDLLIRNPQHVPSTGEWEEKIHDVSSYDTRLIQRHLQRVVRNHSPY